ncbi:Cysteine desulfurase [Lunatimonas lonarensis]|uniref:cysteine desulfurase n=1 Tax=Lunatimonas lonarensis TaxID=1232681 RepID=R7ZXW4_9BACT|nr:cysteine desulfurase family protein [Lunatimonas lonarensis]EON78839.1 Cysteine desulfurase [Lunatimonas lonarensis]
MTKTTAIYLDNAATTALDDRVLEAMLPFLKNQFGNPSSVHKQGREARVAIEKARKMVAGLLNASPGEIVFTSGGTEADNTAILGAITSLNLTQVISSPLEHHAVLHAAAVYAERLQIPFTLLEVDQQGNLDLNQLARLLEKHPKSLVTLMEGNNEIGNLNDLHAIGNLCKESGAFFHSDTVQTVGHYPHNLKSIPVDAISASAHKFHGPKGVGFLYIKKDRKISPFLHGGSQERNMRGGTENVAGIIGLAKALEISYQEMDSHAAHIKQLKSHFIRQLQQQIPGIGFNGRSSDLNQSLYTVLNVSFPPSESNQGMLLFNLDLQGISASGGSACSSGATLGSHVLQALRCTAERESVRFSFSRFNSVEEVDYTVAALKSLYS